MLDLQINPPMPDILEDLWLPGKQRVWANRCDTNEVEEVECTVTQFSCCMGLNGLIGVTPITLVGYTFSRLHMQ